MCAGMPWGGGSAQRPWAKADEWQERNGQGSHKDNDMSSAEEFFQEFSRSPGPSVQSQMGWCDTQRQQQERHGEEAVTSEAWMKLWRMEKRRQKFLSRLVLQLFSS